MSCAILCNSAGPAALFSPVKRRNKSRQLEQEDKEGEEEEKEEKKTKHDEQVQTYDKEKKT